MKVWPLNTVIHTRCVGCSSGRVSDGERRGAPGEEQRAEWGGPRMGKVKVEMEPRARTS